MIITFFVLDGINPKELHSKLRKAYENITPPILTTEIWAAGFNRDQASHFYDLCEGQPKTPTIPETIEKLHDIVLEDWPVNVSVIATVVRMRNVLHKELRIKNFCARWVPHKGAKLIDFVQPFIIMD